MKDLNDEKRHDGHCCIKVVSQLLARNSVSPNLAALSGASSL